jgi:hypothetical protein
MGGIKDSGSCAVSPAICAQTVPLERSDDELHRFPGISLAVFAGEFLLFGFITWGGGGKIRWKRRQPFQLLVGRNNASVIFTLLEASLRKDIIMRRVGVRPPNVTLL